MKFCPRCKENKSFELFDKQKSKKDGYRSHCKECRKQQHNSPEAKERRKKYYLANKQKISEKNKIKYIKNQAYFLKRAELYRNANRVQLNQKRREYYNDHRESDKLTSRRWKASEIGQKKLTEYKFRNKERRKAYMHEYNKSEHGRQTYRNYYHSVRKKNPRFMIAMRIRTQLYERLKRQRNIKRNITFEDAIGCDIPFLEIYLKSTMTEKMTWQMFLDGILVIDHILPCCSFDLADNTQLKKCFNYSNLRLIYHLDNSIKAAQDKKLKLAILNGTNQM